MSLKQPKFNTTTILGIVFFLMGLSMWILWMFMATREMEVLGLKPWYIFAGLGSGTVLIVVPEETAIGYIKEGAKIALEWIKKK